MKTSVFRYSLAVFASAVCFAATGVERTWVGASGGKWADAGNWSPQGVPMGDDVAVFSPEGNITVLVANKTSYAQKLKFVSGVTVFACDGTFAYSDFGSAATGVVEVAAGAVFTNLSVRIEKKNSNLPKSSTS